MDTQKWKSLSDAFHRRMVTQTKKRWPIVATPGPDVLRMRFAVTDLKQNHPVLSDFTTDGPVEFGKNDSQNRYVQSWSVSGATCAELMLFDSMTNDVIAATKDERKPGLKEKFTKWWSAEDASNSGRKGSLWSWIVHGSILSQTTDAKIQRNLLASANLVSPYVQIRF